jgi:hypothetical protein
MSRIHRITVEARGPTQAEALKNLLIFADLTEEVGRQYQVPLTLKHPTLGAKPLCCVVVARDSRQRRRLPCYGFTQRPLRHWESPTQARNSISGRISTKTRSVLVYLILTRFNQKVLPTLEAFLQMGIFCVHTACAPGFDGVNFHVDPIKRPNPGVSKDNWHGKHC